MENEFGSTDPQSKWKRGSAGVFAVGQAVQHKRTEERGIILQEWGSWKACRICFAEMPLGAPQCPSCASPTSKWWRGIWAANTFTISGDGIYEVDFASGRKSVSRDMLKSAS